jgi:uncharacterized membrane protein
LVFEPFSFLFAFFIIFFAFFISFFAFFISFFAFFDLSFLATASSRAALQTPAIYHALRSSSGSFAILAAIRLAEQVCRRPPTWLILEIDVSRLLAVVVAHHKSGV